MCSQDKLWTTRYKDTKTQLPLRTDGKSSAMYSLHAKTIKGVSQPSVSHLSAQPLDPPQPSPVKGPAHPHGWVSSQKNKESLFVFKPIFASHCTKD